MKFCGCLFQYINLKRNNILKKVLWMILDENIIFQKIILNYILFITGKKNRYKVHINLVYVLF